MGFELPELMAAEKTIVSTPDWHVRDVNRNPHFVAAVAALEVDGITVAGFRLRATAIKSLPERAYTLQIEYLQSRGKGGAASRVEWRPVSGHNNKGAGPPEFRFMDINCSHHHRFDLNWAHSPGAVGKGNLPIAIPMKDQPVGLEEPEPDSLEKLLEFVGKEFRINNIDCIPTPPWESNLFAGKLDESGRWHDL